MDNWLCKFEHRTMTPWTMHTVIGAPLQTEVHTTYHVVAAQREEHAKRTAQSLAKMIEQELVSVQLIEPTGVNQSCP